MGSDVWLAIAHHLTVFSLAAILTAELVLVRPGISAADLRRVSRIDLWYGVLAGVAVLVGVARVYFGAKGPAFYGHNPWFWAKMASFAVVGLLSVPPTIAYIRWRRAGGDPTAAQVAGVRRWLMIEGGVFVFIPVFAAAMARWTG